VTRAGIAQTGVNGGRPGGVLGITDEIDVLGN
jgi:hypothetical protein